MKLLILVLLSFLMKIISYFNCFNRYLISIIRIIINKTKLCSKYSYNLFKIIIIRSPLILLKSVSFVLLICSAVSVTSDYLSYPYIYKLIVSDNKYGFDLPAISFCTERNVFFDKNKINEYFNSSEEIKRFEEKYQNSSEREFVKCSKDIEKNEPFSRIHECDEKGNGKYFNLSLIFRPYEKKIFETLSFDEIKNLTISANELFNCSAKLHFRNESFVSNATIIENCFDRFEVLQSIYGNEFGICYTFFAKNYSIFLKDDDYIEFNINYETQQRFLMSLSRIEYLHILYSDFFKFHLLINENRRKFEVNGQSKLNFKRTGLNADLNFRKTSVDLLSTPYMQKCLKYGMS